jgi:hypothetical protein
MLALDDDQLALVRDAARPLPYGVVMRACQQAQAHVLQTYAMCPDENAV